MLWKMIGEYFLGFINRQFELKLAVDKTKEILSNHFPKHISDEIDDEIRKAFPIHLKKSDIGR